MGCLKLEEKSSVLRVVFRKETTPLGNTIMAYTNPLTYFGNSIFMSLLTNGISMSSVQIAIDNSVGKLNAVFGTYNFNNQGVVLNFNFEATPVSQYGTGMLYSNIMPSIASGLGDPCPSCDQAQLALDVAGIFDPSGAIDVTNGGLLKAC